MNKTIINKVNDTDNNTKGMLVLIKKNLVTSNFRIKRGECDTKRL